MAIANSSFGLKKIKVLTISFLFLTSCQMVQRSQTTKGGVPGRPAQPPVMASPTQQESSGPETTETAPTSPTPTPTPAPIPLGVAPKIGLILGPGALRSYAHVGVVQEFAKQKMPIQAIAGIEMGSLVAAIYANKGQPYDVEWQMMKLKESDLVQKGLLSSEVKPEDVRSLQDFIGIALGSARAENAKVHFLCPALQMDRQQIYLMNRGAYSEMLAYCLAFPPLFRPYQGNVSGVLSLKPLIDALKAKGATYIVYVDVLSAPVKISNADQETQVLWNLVAESLNQSEKDVDYVIHVPLKDYDLLDFNRRREMIQKGQQAAVEAASRIMKLLNF